MYIGLNLTTQRPNDGFFRRGVGSRIGDIYFSCASVFTSNFCLLAVGVGVDLGQSLLLDSLFLSILLLCNG